MAISIALSCLLLLLLIFGMLIVILLFLTTDLSNWRIIRKTIWRDIRAIYLFYKLLSFLKISRNLNHSVADRFAITVKKYRNEVCFVYEDEEWTYQQVDEFSNRVANCFYVLGYRKGDEVALLLQNCPEFICLWLGLSKIGVVTALINTNLREEALGHSLNILNLKAVIFGENLSEAIQGAILFLSNRDGLDYYCYHEKNKKQFSSSFPAKSLNTLLDEASPQKIDLGNKKPGFSDKLFYIYTSGTTGLPKAAVIRNSRFLWIASVKYLVQLSGFETFYNPLPLYHSAGGIIFVGYVLITGGKMIIKKKFSASSFWKDVVKHQVTVSQYIGEICRYLFNQPVVPEETQHSIKLLYGNGLKPHIWKEFQDRFKIGKIVEFFGSTEGNTNLANMFGKVGKVGFIPKLANRFCSMYLVKIHPETGELLRDEKGFAIKCKSGEPGELVGKISLSNPLISFDGYADQKATSKKIVRNINQEGDMAFLSGDLLVMDEEGYLSFVDRTGDTYRWKGENVASVEVENILSKALNHATCMVYGVKIANMEGRAGMAAIQIDLEDIKFSELYQYITKKLPAYAFPQFIRISSSVDITGTYKLRKVAFQKDGFDPEKIRDPLFCIDHKQKTYVPLTKKLHSCIESGTIKL